MAGQRREWAFGERGRFLRALAETGEVRAAAQIAGVEPHWLYRRRRYEPAFATEWQEALATRPVIERGRGVTQTKRVTRKQWTAQDAQCAVAVAAETGSLRSVAARTGFCAETIRNARRCSPDFDAAIRAALAEATDRLEAELLDRATEAMSGDLRSTSEAELDPVRFAEALDLVKHRRAVEARDARAQVRARVTRPSLDDVRERVMAKLDALRRARGEDAGEAA